MITGTEGIARVNGQGMGDNSPAGPAGESWIGTEQTGRNRRKGEVVYCV